MTKGKKKRVKVPKEPSLFRKIAEIHFEQVKRRKAIRLLQQQSWSFDFLALLLVKASKIQNTPMSLEITDKQGIKYTLTYDKAKEADFVQKFDDSIFNHLDDDTAIQHFVAEHSRR